MTLLDFRSSDHEHIKNVNKLENSCHVLFYTVFILDPLDDNIEKCFKARTSSFCDETQSTYHFREELQKQQAKERYDKLHMEGKTDEARADLARLALIRKQREEAAKKREEERKGIYSL